MRLSKPATPYPKVCEAKVRKMQTPADGVLSYHNLCTAMTLTAKAA